MPDHIHMLASIPPKISVSSFMGYLKGKSAFMIFDKHANFYAHEAELNWLNGEFPLTMDTIRSMVIDRCDLHEGYDVNTYKFFHGMPVRVLQEGDTIDLGGRVITALYTPGHSPGHLCFWEPQREYLFTGGLVYKDTLFAYYPSTDPQAYLASLEKIAVLPVKKVFPAHHSLDIQPEILIRMRDAFRQLNANGNLHHGSGTFDYAIGLSGCDDISCSF